MVASPEAAGSPGGESPAQQHKTAFPALCLFFFMIHLGLVFISINVFYLSVIEKEPLGGVSGLCVLEAGPVGQQWLDPL